MSLAAHVFVLAEGSIIAEGSPQQIAADARVVEAYLGHGAAGPAHAAGRAIVPADGSAAGAATGTGVCARAGSSAISAAVATAPSRAPRPKKT